jgi:hypothetical protein
LATTISAIEVLARQRLIEPTPIFWTSDEIVQIIIAGIRDLWRDIVDLKQEHYLTIDTTHVTYVSAATQLTGVPADVHKVYLIEALYNGTNQANVGLIFTPQDFNNQNFQMARSRGSIDPTNETIYYAVTDQGAPVSAPIILCAPAVTSPVSVRFCYVPTLGTLTSASTVPIPGEADNALVAWTVAFARGKEREDRSPDSAWLSIYATEKLHLMESLGLRQYQEPQYVPAIYGDYW